MSNELMYEAVTFAHLRREAKWLHLYYTVWGHDREFDVSRPPFEHMPDSTVVPKLGKLMVCSKCGTLVAAAPRGRMYSATTQGIHSPATMFPEYPWRGAGAR